ncbi:MAG: dockerin type I repeat-containing protein [Ruminococcus sp.]|nr:dockerin type I repeat-containing protein [Ruminococcus sp.]
MKNIMSRLTSALIAGAVTVSITAFPAMAEEKENFIGVEPLFLESYFTSITQDNYAVLTDTNNFYPGGNNRYILVLDSTGDMHLVYGRITDTKVKTTDSFDLDSFTKELESSNVQVKFSKNSDTEYTIENAYSPDNFADIVDKLEDTPEVTWIENHYTVYEDTANYAGDYRFYFTDDVTPEYIKNNYHINLEFGGNVNKNASSSFQSEKYTFFMHYDALKKSSKEYEKGYNAEKAGLKADFYQLKSLANCEICDLEGAVTELAMEQRDIHYCTDIVYNGGYNHNNKDYGKLTLDEAAVALYGYNNFFLMDTNPILSSIGSQDTNVAYTQTGKFNILNIKNMRARIKVADGHSLDIEALRNKAKNAGYEFPEITLKGNEYIITSASEDNFNYAVELLKADNRVLEITSDLRLYPDTANLFSLYGFKFDGTRPQEEIIEMYPNAGVALTEIDKQPNNNNDNSFYMGYKYEGASEAHYNDLKAMVENEKCSPYGQYTCLAFFPDTACYCHYTLYDKFADENSEEIILGDANDDKDITVADAVAILQYLGNADKYPLTPQQKINADCYNTGDGITPNDALAIQQYDAKLITHF